MGNALTISENTYRIKIKDIKDKIKKTEYIQNPNFMRTFDYTKKILLEFKKYRSRRGYKIIYKVAMVKLLTENAIDSLVLFSELFVDDYYNLFVDLQIELLLHILDYKNLECADIEFFMAELNTFKAYI